jgi:predicted NBD/HSP70 family sugar kinase
MAGRAAGQEAISIALRNDNAKLILRRLRRLGEASRADLARAAALTDTAVGQIIRQLEQGGLVRTLGKRHEGQRGQPATLLALDPDGAYAIGVRLDRTRIETALADLGGTVLAHQVHDGLLPAPTDAVQVVRGDVERMVQLLPAKRRRRIAGIGVARPDNLGSWLTQLDLPQATFAPWETATFAPALEQACGLPVVEENDGTAAAIAELFHGLGRDQDDFVYVFIGAAVGGGVVLGGQCLRGPTGNAGDIGMIPSPRSRLSSAARPAREGEHEGDILLGRVSLASLFRHLRLGGWPVASLDDLPPPGSTGLAAEWLLDCADALAVPLLSARALLDIPIVVIDSDLPPLWIDQLITLTTPRLAAAVAEARTPPALRRGSFGAMAGALGAATLPLFINLAPGAGGPRPRREVPRQGGAYALVA